MQEFSSEEQVRMEVIFRGEIVEVELSRGGFHDLYQRAAMTRQTSYELLLEDLETAVIIDEKTASDDWTL